MPVMIEADLRRIALSMPAADEKSHFGKPDFRARNKIFASLPDPEHAVIKLTPNEQSLLVDAEPSIFAPVNGGWGRQGWTRLTLAATDEATLRSALTMAWRNVAPAALRKEVDGR